MWSLCNQSYPAAGPASVQNPLKPMKTRPLLRSGLLATAIAALFAQQSIRGADIYWDGTGVDWDVLDNWSTGLAVTTDPSAIPGASDVAYFSVTDLNNVAQTVNLNADQSAAGLVFLNTNTTTALLAGGAPSSLTLGASGILVNPESSTVTIGDLTGSGQEVEIILAAAQTWTSNSTLVIQNSVANGGFLLSVAGSGDAAISGIVSGTGGLTKNGNGTLTLSSENTYEGDTTVSGGVLSLNAAVALPGGIAATGGTSKLILNGGVVGLGDGDFTRGLGTGVAQVLWTGNGGFAAYGGARSVNLGGASGTVTWDTANFVQDTKVLILGAAGASATVTFQNPINLNGAARTIQVDNGTPAIDAVLSGGLSGGIGGLEKTGAGALQIAAASTYSGSTVVREGVLVLMDANALPGGIASTGGTSALTLTGVGVLGLGIADFTRDLGTGANQVQWTGSGGFAAYGLDRTINLGGALAQVTWNSGGFVPTGSALILSAAGSSGMVTFQNPINLDNASRTVQVNNGGTVPDATLSGVISGTTSSGGLTKAGLGTLSLTNNNTYTGPTIIKEGTLRVSTIGNGGASGNMGAASTDAGNLVFDGDTQGRSTLWYAGSTAPTDRNFIINDTKTAFIDVSNVNTTLTMSGASTATSGALIKQGEGKLSLTGANQYTGTTTVEAGTLIIGHATALGTAAAGTSVSAGATLQIQGSIIVGDEALILNGTGVSGGGALRNASGTNTYGGLIQLVDSARINSDSSSVLTLTNAGSITGSGLNLTVGGGGITQIDSKIETGSGSLIRDTAGGRVILTGANSYTGATTITLGILQLGNGNLTGSLSPSSQISIATGGTLVFNRSNTLTQGTDFETTIAGAGNGGIIQAGAGETILSGLNTYLGKTTIQAGTLTINTIKNVSGGSTAVGAPTSSTNGTIAIGSTTTAAQLNYNGDGGANGLTNRVIQLAGTTGGAVISQSGTGLLKFTSNLSVPGVADTDQRKTLTLQGSTLGTGEISGIIPDAVLGTSGQTATKLTKDGTGTWTLSGANSYTGDTTISGGKLVLGNGGTTGTLATASAINNNANLTFNRSDTITQGSGFNSVISGTGSVITTGGTGGTGVTVLNGVNLYSGGTTVSGGTLTVNNTSGSGTGSGLVTVESGAKLKGTGIIGGATTIQGGATHSPGNSPGVETFLSGITYNTSSVFEWELSTNVAKLSGGIAGAGVRGTDFDGVDVTSGAVTINSGAIFKILLGEDFVPTATFWDSRQVWNVFQLNPLADPVVTKTGVFSTFQVWDANGIDPDIQYNTDYSSQGYFSYAYNTDGLGTYSGNLIWTAVPEPTSALAGLLLGAGLLRRRRKLA